MNQPGALSNLTILDLSRVLCGPYITMLFADFGAQIIKVENPDGGDDTRSWGPMRNGESTYFAAINRNKQSITLNLKTPEGKALFLELVKKVDVVLENFRPGVMKRLGLGFEDLCQVNDKIIYACVSGFGTYGPYAQRPGYDLIAQGMSGVMSITGRADDPPTRVGMSLGDVMGGLNVGIGILAALNARSATGKPQYIEVSLVDSIVSGLATNVLSYLEHNEIPQRTGNHGLALSPYDSYCAKDGSFIIACGNQKLFEALCTKVLNRPELIEDARYRTMPDRAANENSLKMLIEQWAVNETVDSAVEKILAAGIPAGPILDMGQVVEDEHIAKAREMYVPMQHPLIGNMIATGNPIKMDGVHPEKWEPAPTLGQHNAAVYGRLLGLDAAALAELKEKGAI